MCQDMYTSNPPTRAGWEETITEILTPRNQSAHKTIEAIKNLTLSEEVHKGLPWVALC